MNRMTVLVADGDRDLRQQLSRFLTDDGFVVVRASNERNFISTVRAVGPDVIVLGDLGDAGPHAQLVEQFRRGEITGHPNTTPVLVLAEDDDALTLTRCFLAGADDFRTKPIGHAELTARLLALLRRGPRVAPSDSEPRDAGRLRIFDGGSATVDCDALKIDRAALAATFDGKPLNLTRMEFTLLVALAMEPAQVRSKNELLLDVWGYRSLGKTRTIDVTACRLRRKLADVGATGWVMSVRGVGYRLVDGLDDASREPDAAR